MTEKRIQSLQTDFDQHYQDFFNIGAIKIKEMLFGSTF